MNHITIYEIKTLTRDCGFRSLAFISILGIAFLQAMAQGNLKQPEWIAISLPSAIPFANAYLANHLQILIAIFWAGRFIRKEQQTDTSDSIQIRPFSNRDYLWGKTLGFIIVLLGLDILLTGIAMLIHLCISDSPFALYPYLFYLVTLTLPALVFTTGLVIYVKGIIRNTALSLMILFIFFYFQIMHGTNLFYGITNPFAASLPNVFSDITGFAGMNLYLLHRLTYLLWGLGLLFIGTQAVDRIPNNPRTRHKMSITGLTILFLGCIPSWIYIYTFVHEKHERESTRTAFLKYEEAPKARITNHTILFQQNKHNYTASSRMTIINPNVEALDSIIFYLTPN